MSWPCPDCNEPFVPNHMCPEMRAHLEVKGAQHTWRWLARTMMLEARGMHMAYQVEQCLRVGVAHEEGRQEGLDAGERIINESFGRLQDG